jgi:hypothetical protein
MDAAGNDESIPMMATMVPKKEVGPVCRIRRPERHDDVCGQECKLSDKHNGGSRHLMDHLPTAKAEIGALITIGQNHATI